MGQTKSSSQKLVSCQVPGCTEDLQKQRGYFVTKRICPVHVKAPMVMLHGREMRFCQQCGRFHELQAFEGKKRSCMAKLDKRKELYAQQQAAAVDDESSCMTGLEAPNMVLLGMMAGLPMAVAPAASPAALQLCVPALMQLQQQQALTQALWQKQQQGGALDSWHHSCSHSCTAWQPHGDVSPTIAPCPASHNSGLLSPVASAITNSSEAADSSNSSSSSSATSSSTTSVLQPAAAPAAVADQGSVAAAAAAAAGGAPASEAAPGALPSNVALHPPCSTQQLMGDVWADFSNLQSWSEQDLDSLLDDMLQPLECPSDLLQPLEACSAPSTSASGQLSARPDLWLELPPAQASMTSLHTASSSCSEPKSTADWAVMLSDMLSDGEGPAAVAAGDRSTDKPQKQGGDGMGTGAACNEPGHIKAITELPEDKEVIRQGLASLQTQFSIMQSMIAHWEANLEQAS